MFEINSLRILLDVKKQLHLFDVIEFILHYEIMFVVRNICHAQLIWYFIFKLYLE